MEMLYQVEKLVVSVSPNREDLGKAAAKHAAERINAVIRKNGCANVIFAAAPSQNELIENLLNENVDWTKVRGFHQDEYVGISDTEPAGFGNFLRRAIFDRVQFKELHYLLCEEADAQAQCGAYADLLKKYPADLIFLGIGENGHLAFNDPAVADFQDPEMVKIVELDDVCRQQQVNDGCFAALDDVPKKAMTLTMSYLMKVPNAICVVPGPRKANAVYNALCGPVETACPASILRYHTCATLYLDEDSANLLPKDKM